MRLLIDETFATSTYRVPVSEGWVSPPEGTSVELVPGLTAAQIAAGDVALAPSAAILALSRSHEIVPGVAVVADGVGAVAMRTPVRPDEIEATPVRLVEVSGGELLARATLQSFYGIEPTSWHHDRDAGAAASAEVVIVEGAEALREPEAGFSEDLSRAWFIMTAQPVVSHLLLVPRDLPAPQRVELVAFANEAGAAGLARRREWRAPLADREGIDRDRAGAFWAAQRLQLEAVDRQALLDLLQKGSSGTSSAVVGSVQFSDGADSM